MNQGNSDVNPRSGLIGQGGLNPLTRWLLFPCCALIVWLLYLPVAGHYFVSDDFKVLRRVCIEEQMLIPGFFRPLSDLTIFANSLVHGLDARVFNAFNLLVHAGTGTLLFRFAFRFYRGDAISGGEESPAFLFALISTVLFISYPFHNEAIVWLLGRGASMAAFFCLAAMCVCQRSPASTGSVLAASAFYFIALLAYESAFPLPVILWLLLKKENRPLREQVRLVAAMGVTLAAHILLRILFSGSLAGGYGTGFLEENPAAIAGNVFRISARLFLPPLPSVSLFLIISSALLLAISGTVWGLYRQRSNPLAAGCLKRLKWLALMTVSGSLVPYLTGVSLHTSESDRMLYLPSVFVGMMAAAVLLRFSFNQKKFLLLLPVLLGIQIFWLEKNNLRWREAGAMTKDLVTKAAPAGSGRRIVFLDLPGDLNGAFVFRQGFKDALILNSKDSVLNIAVFSQALSGADPKKSLDNSSAEYFVWNAALARWTRKTNQSGTGR